MAELAHALPQPGETPWPAQGRWTWTDYLRLPQDGQRYEIIGGTLYVSPAPAFDHQFCLAKLFARLNAFVEERELGLILTAPFDVLLPGVASPVQPDLLFFATGNQPRPGDLNFEGVPDLIVEIVSAGSSRLDQHVKFAAYEEAGVREYWLVHPKTRSIAVYVLDPGARKYAELGHWGPGETTSSALLTGFRADVRSLFPPAPED